MCVFFGASGRHILVVGRCDFDGALLYVLSPPSFPGNTAKFAESRVHKYRVGIGSRTPTTKIDRGFCRRYDPALFSQPLYKRETDRVEEY